MVKLVCKAPDQYVYLLQSREIQSWYKIGFSCDPARRVAELNKATPGLAWRLMAEIYSVNAPRLEKAYHAAFASKRISPRREWFELDAVDVELFVASASSVEVSCLEWQQEVVQKLLDHRQPLVAAHIDTAYRARLEGTILRIFFPPTTPSFCLRLTEDAHHRRALQKAVEAVIGKRPTEVQCEVPRVIRNS